MEKVSPGSVAGSGPERWYAGPQYKELYNEVIVLVTEHLKQKKKEVAAAKIKQSKIHAHRLGVEDGLTGERTQKDDAVPKARTGADVPFDLELNNAYETGFKEGQAAVEKAVKRAHDLGAKDRKDGKPADTDALKNFPEYEGNVHADLRPGAFPEDDFRADFFFG